MWPRIAEVWLRDPRRLRACGSEVCAAKSCFACTIDRGFVATDGRGLAARSQKIACGSEVYMRDPRIIVQKLGPRFAQQNPWMVRIRTLRITYIYSDLYTAIYILYIGVYI